MGAIIRITLSFSSYLRRVGYVEFEKAVRLATVREFLPDAHWEIARGSKEQNIDYCTKDDTRVDGPFFSSEEWRAAGGGQGHRSDLQRAISTLKETRSLTRVAEEHPEAIIRYGRNFQFLQQLLQGPRQEGPVRVVFLQTPTGFTKTSTSQRFLAARCGGHEGYYIWSAKHDKGWWDGYEGQDWVLIDELAPKTLELGELLRILQELPYRVPVHGGSINMRAHNFIITTNATVTNLFLGKPAASIAAFERRITGQLDDEDRELLEAKTRGERATWIREWLEEQFPDGEDHVGDDNTTHEPTGEGAVGDGGDEGVHVPDVCAAISS